MSPKKMKANLFILTLATLLGLFQTSLLPNLSILGVRPDFVLLAVIIVGLVWGMKYGILLAVVGGLVLDVSGSGLVGLSSVALLPVAVLTNLESVEMVESKLPSTLMMTILGTVLYYLALMLFRGAGDIRLPWLDLLINVVPLSVLVNCMLALPMLGLFGLVSERFQPEAGRDP
ncbi:MAG: rod shape-determining protein MreD [Dehalococcoidia bacterium]|nr:rod shape-determining protein MreD [Dehalococcoidia bacterium]